MLRMSQHIGMMREVKQEMFSLYLILSNPILSLSYLVLENHIKNGVVSTDFESDILKRMKRKNQEHGSSCNLCSDCSDQCDEHCAKCKNTNVGVWKQFARKEKIKRTVDANGVTVEVRTETITENGVTTIIETTLHNGKIGLI